GSDSINRNLRIAVGSLPICHQRLDDQQLLPVQRWMLDRRVRRADNESELHDYRFASAFSPTPINFGAGSRRGLPRMHKSSINEHRRSRVNVSGVVTPSPVGPAIENDKYPSPPRPSDAMHGPFFTNSVVSMIRPMYVMFFTLFEWMMLVCRKPCSASFARSTTSSKLRR